MRVGYVYPHIELGGNPNAVRQIGLALEDIGYDHLLSYDHVLGAVHEGRVPELTGGPYTENDPFHDTFVIFAYLAAITQRLEFASGILILPQRQTVLVARQAADVALLSGGRLRLGVATGWNYVEYDAMGEDFFVRGRRIDEQIDLLRTLWSEPVVTFTGSFDKVDRAALNPRPQRPVPLWVGGMSEKAFRRGARVGDGFIFAGTIDDCLRDLRLVQRYLEEAGRSPDEFGTEFIGITNTSIDEIASSFERWEAAGGTHATVFSMGFGFDSANAHIDYLGRALEAIKV